jgi:hypothetical protein
MQPQTRALPSNDLAALLGVVAVVHGQLMIGDLPPDLTQRLIRRLSEHGPLLPGSTAGALNATLTDLGRRLHWAAGADMEYPAATPQRTTYELSIPAGCVAACIAALRDAGADDIQDGPLTATGWEMRPTGPGGALQRHSTDVPDGRTVTATFPDLPLDPAYQDRIVQLRALAEHHGGQYQGASW